MCALDPHAAHVIDVSRRGIDQYQAFDQLRVRGCKVLRDQPPERDAGDMSASYTLSREEHRQLAREILDSVGLVRDARVAVAWKVVAEQAEACLEPSRRHVPQAVVDAEAMEKDEGGA